MKKYLVTMCSTIIVTIIILSIYHSLMSYKFYVNMNSLLEPEDERQSVIDISTNIQTLESKIIQLEQKLYTDRYVMESILSTNQKANLFVKSYIDIDIDTMKELVSENIIITNECITFQDNTEIKLNYLSKNTKYNFQLNGYTYEDDNCNGYIIYYHYILYDNNIPKVFMNIGFKRYLDLWKIYTISFDV